MATNQAIYPGVLLQVTDDPTTSLFDDLFLDDATYGLLDGTRDWATALYVDDDPGSVVSMTVSRGRKNMRDPFGAGTAQIVFDNTAGAVNLANIRAGQRMTITAQPGNLYTVFNGQIAAVTEQSDPVTGVTFVSVTGVDWLRRLADWTQAPAASSAAGQTVTQRISQAITVLAGQPNFETDIGTSTVTVAATDWAGTLLGACEDAAFADGGYFFVDVLGAYKFIPRTEIYDATRYASPVVTISSAAAATHPARSFDTIYSPNRVANQVFITGADGITRGAVDGSSQTLVGNRMTRLTTIAETQTQSASLASLYAAVWARQYTQYAPLEIHAGRGSWAASDLIAQLELGDPLTIADGSDVDVILEGIEHAWTPGNGWTAKLHTNRAVPEVAS